MTPVTVHDVGERAGVLAWQAGEQRGRPSIAGSGYLMSRMMPAIRARAAIAPVTRRP
jgi:hypothetical protein